MVDNNLGPDRLAGPGFQSLLTETTNPLIAQPLSQLCMHGTELRQNKRIKKNRINVMILEFPYLVHLKTYQKSIDQ